MNEIRSISFVFYIIMFKKFGVDAYIISNYSLDLLHIMAGIFSCTNFIIVVLYK